jgi:hypothetical protein
LLLLTSFLVQNLLQRLKKNVVLIILWQLSMEHGKLIAYTLSHGVITLSYHVISDNVITKIVLTVITSDNVITLSLLVTLTLIDHFEHYYHKRMFF